MMHLNEPAYECFGLGASAEFVAFLKILGEVGEQNLYNLLSLILGILWLRFD